MEQEEIEAQWENYLKFQGSWRLNWGLTPFQTLLSYITSPRGQQIYFKDINIKSLQVPC